MSSLYTHKTIQTPSVVGMSLNNAARILSEHNLNLRILAEKEDPDLPSGTIISQVPVAHSPIKPHQSLFLVTSTTPQPTTSPRLVSHLVDNVEDVLTKKGIKYKLYTLESNYPTGTCIGQWPAAGNSLDNNKLIAYVSTTNSKPVLMPNLVGRTVPEVADFLTSHEMIPQLIHNPSVPDGHICSTCYVTDQRPLAGSLIARNGKNPAHIHLQVEER